MREYGITSMPTLSERPTQQQEAARSSLVQEGLKEVEDSDPWVDQAYDMNMSAVTSDIGGDGGMIRCHVDGCGMLVFPFALEAHESFHREGQG